MEIDTRQCGYDKLSEQIDIKNRFVRFYNHGYYSEVDLLPYDSDDLLFKYRANLYAYLIENFNTVHENKSVLDIGCGLGRGCNVLKKYYKFKKITGIDLNAAAIKFAKKNFPGINFLEMDATKINLKEKFDLILSVEAFGYFGYDINSFKSLYDILNYDGSVRIAVNLKPEWNKPFNDNIIQSGLKIKEIKNINKEVIKSCEKDYFNFPDNFPEVNKEWINQVQINMLRYKRQYETGERNYLVFDLVKYE